MKNNKIKKFRKFRDSLWYKAGGTLVAGMMFMSANTAFAQANDITQSPRVYAQATSTMHKASMMRRWNSGRKVSVVAQKFGLDPEKVKAELKSGKTMKQILIEHGIDTTRIVR
jgi:hypothetical protein